MSCNFHLRKQLNSRGEKPLYLISNIGGKISEMSTGIFLKPDQWNSSKQQVNRKHPNYNIINDRLLNIKQSVQQIELDAKFKSIADFKAQVKRIITPTKQITKDSKLISDFHRYLQLKKENFSNSAYKNNKVVLNHLNDFLKSTNNPDFDYDDVDLMFYDNFKSFLLHKNMINNSAHKIIRFFKTFMNWGLDRKLHTNMEFKKFNVKEDEVDIVYLTKDELASIENIKLDLPSLEQVRDIFCFQCFTGQRFIDVKNMRYKDLSNGTWVLKTQKTKETLTIPLIDRAKKVLDKYPDLGKLPTISNQKTNDYIKEVCRLAGVTQIVSKYQYKGSERIEIKKPKYKLISTHTARRTFVTLSLEMGMRPETIMKITGHKDLKMLQKYIKITNKVVEEELKRYW